MASERFTLTALPFSCASAAAFHVSLFVGPRLDPGGEGRLEDFAHLPRWTRLLTEDATFELRDQEGVIAATPLLDELEPDVWEAVFPPESPVRGPARPAFEDRPWSSFRAAEVHDYGKLLHLAAMYADPGSPPRPSAHPLARLMRPYIPPRGRGTYDESVITAQLDEIVESRESLEVIERMVDSEEDWLRRLALQVHRARRYYERPESQGDYRERPDPSAVAERPPRPEPDFHERCTLAGDHPALLRRLGLVVDLRVEDADRLRRSEWLSARIVPAGDQAACLASRTRCEAVGDDLVSIAAGPEWRHGRLRLGDPDQFALLELDADGTALKLDRFLWTLPRLMAAEANGDPVHAAPPALRSTGFTLARHRRAARSRERLGRQEQLRSALEQGELPLLATEDLSRGVRVEVWDGTERRWYTLHARLADVEVHGHGEVLTALAEEGFVQGAAAHVTPNTPNAPVHLHEAVFGWEGWSLSAPRPGKRVRHEDGEEKVEDPDADPDPVTPVVIDVRAAPGTLPRLRFGRAYAFRAWNVDLAGNSRPHGLGSAGPDGEGLTGAVAVALGGDTSPLAVAAHLAPELRVETHAALTTARLTAPGDQVAAAEPHQLELVGDAALDRVVLGRLRERRGQAGPSGPALGAGRGSVVERVMRSALAEGVEPFVVDTAVREPGPLAAIVSAAERAAVDVGELVASTLELVTPLRPFLRWDPVGHPAIVPRHRYTAGESLRQVVVRSGVEQDPDTLAITITEPGAYAREVGSTRPELSYRAAAERHLVPPKTSQAQAELHGLFDTAIGSSDPAEHRRLLAVALRDSGTLFDLEVPRLEDPSRRDAQPGVALESDPGVPASELKALPLALGEAPATGQYVVHDVDDLRVPYLPDPLARGVSLVFSEAGGDRRLPFPFGTEGMTARYGGEWPEREPFRLVLEGGERLAGTLEGSVLRLRLPAADVQRFRLSSSLDRPDLDLLGAWRSLPASVNEDEDVAESATDGWLWGLTPFEEVTLVHAVTRPLQAPRPVVLRPQRDLGSTEARLLGAVDVHGPSTESLTLEATWIEPADDLTLPVPEERPQRGVAFTTPVRHTEDLALLGKVDSSTSVPGFGTVHVHAAVHRLGDTRHRRIDYRFRAATRFREYFDPALLAPAAPPSDPSVPADDGQSVVGPPTRVSVPSSAQPAAPVVHSVVPLFRWDEGEEPEQPVAVRRRRRAGVRIYLERPWWSSGEGELLGVLVAPRGVDLGIEPWVSQWGGDPVWLSATVGNRAMLGELDHRVALDDLVNVTGLEDRPADAGPVTPLRIHPLAGLPRRPSVGVLGYRPSFNAERGPAGLWYVDVAIDPGSAFWPFVRLAVARYQPESIADCHLSAPVRCPFAQLVPERTTSVSRPDARQVRVVVSGPVGVRTTERFPTDIQTLSEALSQNRSLFARLQRRDPAIPTDLGWDTVAVTPLLLRGTGATGTEAAWVGSLALPGGEPDIALTRPGANRDWRVTVEEWEHLPGDPSPLSVDVAGSPTTERRLVYADELAL